MDGSVTSWATEAEIIAAAYRFDMDVFVKSNLKSQSHWQKYPPADECNHKKIFICLNYVSNHFNFIKTSHRPCDCCLSNTEVLDHRLSTDPIINTLDSEENDVETEIIDIPNASNIEMEVINKSSKKPTNAHLILLKKGLQFVPTNFFY